MKIVKWFSVLVASGNGQRCHDLKERLNDELFQIDKETGKYKLFIWKFGNETDSSRVAKSLGSRINPLFKDIPSRYFSIDIRR